MQYIRHFGLEGGIPPLHVVSNLVRPKGALAQDFMKFGATQLLAAPDAQRPRSAGPHGRSAACRSTARRNSRALWASGRHNSAPKQSRRPATAAACPFWAILPMLPPDRIGGTSGCTAPPCYD